MRSLQRRGRAKTRAYLLMIKRLRPPTTLGWGQLAMIMSTSDRCGGPTPSGSTAKEGRARAREQRAIAAGPQTERE